MSFYRNLIRGFSKASDIKRVEGVALVSSDQIHTFVDGTDTYVCKASAGTALLTAEWQVIKIDTDENVFYPENPSGDISSFYEFPADNASVLVLNFAYNV